MRSFFNQRSGTSLLEVLVAMMIMALGVTTLIALFPVAVHRTREAVLDTRTTLMAENAKEIVALQQLPNDPNLIRLDLDPNNTTLVPPGDGDPLDGRTSTHLDWNNWYAWLPDDAASATQYQVAQLPGAADVWSYPLFLDPMLVVQQQPATGFVTIPIADYYSNAGLTSVFRDIGVFSVAMWRESSTGAIVQLSSLQQQAFVHRWFASINDVAYDEGNQILPLNLQATTNPTVLDYVDPALGSGNPTASRNYDYTWALMFQRRLVRDPDQATSPIVPRPDRSYSGDNLRIYYLCFHKRDFANPFTITEGCFFEGSNKATLSWPATAPRPEIRRGTWLMEASVTGNVLSGTYAGVYQNYRQRFSFHQVSGYSDPILNGSRFFQEVQLTQPANADLLRGHPQGDIRPVDTYPAAGSPGAPDAWPIAATNVTAGMSIYFPVVIFNGLQHVFRGEG